jgi:hypothetical protein
VNLPVHISFVSEVDAHIERGAIAGAAAAVQRQPTRDVGPLWNVNATIDVFPTLDEVPIGYFPVIMSTEFTFPSLGVQLARDGQSFALINYTDGWPLTLSHEVIEATAHLQLDRGLPREDPTLRDAVRAGRDAHRSAASRADALRVLIEEIQRDGVP